MAPSSVEVALLGCIVQSRVDVVYDAHGCVDSRMDHPSVNDPSYNDGYGDEKSVEHVGPFGLVTDATLV